MAPTRTAGDRQRAEHHANEAERLLESWFVTSHVKAQVHATLAVYHSEQARGPETESRSDSRRDRRSDEASFRTTTGAPHMQGFR